jgi:hypothetical protein
MGNTRSTGKFSLRDSKLHAHRRPEKEEFSWRAEIR